VPEVVVHVGASHTQTSFLAGRPVAGGRSAVRVVSWPDLGGDESQVERRLASLPHPPERAVLVVRDLHRQLPVLWQQELLDGGTESFEEYVDRLAADHDRLGGPWRSIDPVTALEPWARRIGASHVHVVTAPPPGQLDELWRRFTEAAGQRPHESRLGLSRVGARAELADQLMTPAAAEVLRALNVSPTDDADDTDDPGGNDEHVARLALRSGLGLTADDAALWTHPVVTRWSVEGHARLKACGYVVHGSLDDLLRGPPSVVEPATDAAELDAAVGALRALVQLTADRSPHRADSAAMTWLKTAADALPPRWLPPRWLPQRLTSRR
jgi:hypothetical protein